MDEKEINSLLKELEDIKKERDQLEKKMEKVNKSLEFEKEKNNELAQLNKKLEQRNKVIENSTAFQITKFYWSFKKNFLHSDIYTKVRYIKRLVLPGKLSESKFNYLLLNFLNDSRLKHIIILRINNNKKQKKYISPLLKAVKGRKDIAIIYSFIDESFTDSAFRRRQKFYSPGYLSNELLSLILNYTNNSVKKHFIIFSPDIISARWMCTLTNEKWATYYYLLEDQLCFTKTDNMDWYNQSVEKYVQCNVDNVISSSKGNFSAFNNFIYY